MEVTHGNNPDCSISAFSTRRRGLGLFAVAALTRLLGKHAHSLLDPIRGMPVGDRLPLHTVIHCPIDAKSAEYLAG